MCVCGWEQAKKDERTFPRAIFASTQQRGKTPETAHIHQNKKKTQQSPFADASQLFTPAILCCPVFPCYKKNTKSHTHTHTLPRTDIIGIPRLLRCCILPLCVRSILWCPIPARSLQAVDGATTVVCVYTTSVCGRCRLVHDIPPTLSPWGNAEEEAWRVPFVHLSRLDALYRMTVRFIIFLVCLFPAHPPTAHKNQTTKCNTNSHHFDLWHGRSANKTKQNKTNPNKTNKCILRCRAGTLRSFLDISSSFGVFFDIIIPHC